MAKEGRGAGRTAALPSHPVTMGALETAPELESILFALPYGGVSDTYPYSLNYYSVC